MGMDERYVRDHSNEKFKTIDEHFYAVLFIIVCNKRLSISYKIEFERFQECMSNLCAKE